MRNLVLFYSVFGLILISFVIPSNSQSFEDFEKSTAISANDSMCFTEEIENNSCEFYKKCLNSHFQCDAEKGYPLGFAYHYCSSFSVNSIKYSEPIQKWVRDVKVCLKRSLLNYYQDSVNNNKYDCDGLKKLAFESHPKCYIDSGICQLVVGKTIETFQMFQNVFANIQTLAKFTSDSKLWLIQIKETIQGCFGKLKDDAALSLKEKISSLFDNTKEFLNFEKQKKLTEFMEKMIESDFNFSE